MLEQLGSETSGRGSTKTLMTGRLRKSPFLFLDMGNRASLSFLVSQSLPHAVIRKAMEGKLASILNK